MLTGIVFWVLAVIAVATGVAVFRVDSMARATYALAASFIAVGLVLGAVGGLALVRARTAVARRHRVRTAVKRAEKRLGLHASS